MTDLLDILIDLLAEFALPEPDATCSIETKDGDISVLLAWPDSKLAVRQGHTPDADLVGEWTIWECHDESSGRIVLRAVADSLKIDPNVLRLDFTRVKGLLDAGQYDAARESLEELESQIQPDHPDWAVCGKYRKEIRIALRKARSELPRKQPLPPKPSFPAQIKKDAERMVSSHETDFNIIGFFSPEDETQSTVDAVWAAQIRTGSIHSWTACVQGNPAYEADPNWEPVGTEVELLEGLFDRLGRLPTFVWGAGKTVTLMKNWHYRVKGMPLTDIGLMDLQLIAQIGFPTAHRTDLPESLCRQLGVTFCDQMGLGGPLAAMMALIQRISDQLRTLPDDQRAALRTLLNHVPSKGNGKTKPANDSNKGDPALFTEWVDYFLPSAASHGFDGYLHLLLEHFQKLPEMVLKSEGRREGPEIETTEFFRKDGFLSKAASFEYLQRPEQVGFSQRIEECISDTRPYLLEAGTGIGKTIGYLVPALVSGRRTFISTHTKSLQDQAWDKDVPLVLKAFSLAGIERTVAIIKGKGNYVCLQTVADMLEAAHEFISSPEDCFFLAALVNWLMETRTGWLNEIEHLGHFQLLKLLGRDLAPPKLREEWADIDPHARARDFAGKSDLVLANHSYVFALANTADASKNEIETLILDEAHNVDAVVTEILTLHFRPWTLLQELQSLLKRDMSGKVQGLYRALIKHPQIREIEVLKQFVTFLQQYEKELTTWCQNAQIRLNGMFPQIQNIDPDYPLSLQSSEFWVESLYASAIHLKKIMSSFAGVTHDLLENLHHIKGLPRRMSGSLGSLEEHLNDNIEALDDLFEKKADWVHWVEARVKTDSDGFPVKDGSMIAWTLELHSTPLDIAGWLKEHVNSLYKHRAYVSATLTVGGSFDPIGQRLGLSADEDSHKPVTGIYPSPFDYRKQALMAVPHDIPLADTALKIDPLYMEEQSKLIANVAAISDGRMLVLFTSTLTMREMAPRLQARLRDRGIIVLVQTDASRSALIDRLREAPRKGEKIVLLGVRSFWEGIDISGEALSVLVVTRLPFDYHGHPVVRAKKVFYESQGHDRDYFRDYSVPTAFLHLRQMYGRLIRSESDRGATVITDPRIYIKQYGRALLHSLPETTTVIDKSPVVVDAVGRFLHGEPVESSYVWGSLPTASYDLSPDQRAIVECPSKRILVRAAAGSGKTHVLITRLIRLIEGGHANPEEVLALTFTNKAMRVMYERIEYTLGGEKAYLMHRNILTYHKLAMRIIRQDDREKGSETAFLDEKDPEQQKELFHLARQSAGLTESVLNDEDALTLIGYAQNGLVNEAELESNIPAFKDQQPLLGKFAIFFLTYVTLLRERGLIDYGEAIVGAVRILRANKDQAQRWSNRFKWIFCDEYQDTSPAQATLLQLLGQQANLFVVGDNNQSIYSWQGSDPENLRRFELDFPNTASFHLSKNYRCFPKLVRTSARFLERSGETDGIRIEYDEKRSTEDQSVYFLHNEDDQTEASSLAELVKTALDLEIPGDPPKKATVGILARKWHLLEAVEIELIKQGIPYDFEGDTARGIVASQRVRDLVRRGADLLSRQADGCEFGDSLEGRVGQSLQSGKFNTADLFLKALRDAIPGEHLSGNDANDFNRLCAIMKDKDPTVVGGLFGVDQNDSHVILSTVHSQKGEEFDTVIVLGLEKGNSPHDPPKAHERLLDWRKIVQSLSHATWRSPITSDDLQQMYDQEEKRIFYVAMTRAKYNLIISRAEERRDYRGRKRRYIKSEFLDLSSDPKCVAEASASYEVKISAPVIKNKEEGYRTDGRVYLTKNGVLVRSKSEMLLANEFTSRGMYFEYEEPSENIPDALPDFTFPDYGDIILEHLGMVTDPNYFIRWEAKAKEYHEKGIKFLRTGEEDVRDLSNTVDRLKHQFQSWVEQQYGNQRLRLIDAVENVRRDLQLKILRPISAFEDAIFEVDHPEITIVAFCIDQFFEETFSTVGAWTDQPPKTENFQYQSISWSKETFKDITLWIARTVK